MADPYTLTKGELEYADRAALLEREARDALSGRLEVILTRLFPQAPGEFLTANGHFANELARGAGEIADAVSGASINWTGPTNDTGVERLFTRELVRLLAVDALVTAKLALFPRINENGEFEVEALTGYLHPVFSPTNALRVIAVLQILPVQVGEETLYQVRRYSPGLLEVFPPVQNWKEHADRQPEATYPQTHARDRLPLAFMVVRRDANRQPFGLVAECLSAFRRYAKSAINRNAVQEIAGWPERVVNSDTYLKLALGQTQLPQGYQGDPLAELKKVGPRQLKLLGTGDQYEVQSAVDPKPHMDAEVADKQALLDLLRSPDLSGGNLSGVALAERQTKSRSLIGDLANAIADVVTDTCALASALPQTNIGEGIRASLTPRWATDNQSRIQQVADLYSKGAIPGSVALQELQTSGFASVTDEMIEAAQQQEANDAIPNLMLGAADD